MTHWAIEEAERNHHDAQRTLREAQHAEQQATRRFADGKISFHELREAIRTTAFAEMRIKSTRDIESNMRRIYRGKQ